MKYPTFPAARAAENEAGPLRGTLVYGPRRRVIIAAESYERRPVVGHFVGRVPGLPRLLPRLKGLPEAKIFIFIIICLLNRAFARFSVLLS